jgi:hypothetical protein
VRQAGRARAAAGENVGLAWQAVDEHHFDSAAGHRIATPVDTTPNHRLSAIPVSPTLQGALR